MAWQTITNYFGLNSLRKASELLLGEAADTLNSDHSSSTSVGPLKGYSLFGNQANTDHVITRQYTYADGLGFEIDLQVRDDTTNSHLEYRNPGDDRNSSNGEWVVLVPNLVTAVNSDGTVNKRRVMGFAPFNDTGTNNLLFCNGSDNFSRWSGAVCRADGAITAGASTITVEKVPGDPKTNATDGFASSGTLVYKDTAGNRQSLAYSSKTATTFTMTTPANTTASADNTGICEAADTTTYSAVPKNNILITAQGRVWAAGADANPNQLTYTKLSDFTDWTTSTDFEDAGSEDFPDGGSGTGLGSIDQWIIFFKEKQVWAFTLNPITVNTARANTPIRKLICRVGCANQKAIANVNDDLWFVTPHGQIRSVSRLLQGESGFESIDLSNKIRPSIKNFVWDDAAAIWWPKERMFVLSGRSSSTVTINDRAVVIQQSILEDGSTHLNHGILDWFIGDFHLNGENLYFGSSVDSRNYKAFDGYSKNGAPYAWKYTTRIEDFGNQWIKKEVRHLAVKGYIGSGTVVKFTVYWDEFGWKGVSEMELTADDGGNIVLAQALNTLGTFSLGTQPLGGNIDDLSELSPFNIVFPLPSTYLPYNVQLIMETSGIGQRCEITSHAWDVEDAEEHVDMLILKAQGASF